MKSFAVNADIENVDYVLDNFTKCQCNNGKIVSAEAKNRNSDNGAADCTDNSTYDNSNNKTEYGAGNCICKCSRCNNTAECTKAHKSCVTKAELAQNTYREVKRNCHYYIAAHRYKKALHLI